MLGAAVLSNRKAASAVSDTAPTTAPATHRQPARQVSTGSSARAPSAQSSAPADQRLTQSGELRTSPTPPDAGAGRGRWFSMAGDDGMGRMEPVRQSFIDRTDKISGSERRSSRSLRSGGPKTEGEAVDKPGSSLVINPEEPWKVRAPLPTPSPPIAHRHAVFRSPGTST